MLQVRKNIYDNMKGIGILLVVLGHVWIAPSFLIKLIYAFHMPMFFIIAGYLFNVEKKKEIEFSEFAIERFKRLYLPSLFIGFTCAIPSILSGRTDSSSEFLTRSFGIIYSIPKSNLTFDCTPIWFLTCLLCVEIYFYIISKYVKEYVWLVVVFAFSIGVILSRELTFYSPLNSHIALSGLFFFYLGNLLRKEKFVEYHKPKFIYVIIATFALLVSTYLNPIQVGWAKNRLGDLNYLILGAVSGSYLVYFFAKLLGDNLFIGFIGRNTILILGYNYWGYIIVDHAFRRFDLPYNWVINFVVQILLFTLASLALTKMPTLNRLIQGNAMPNKRLQRAIR